MSENSNIFLRRTILILSSLFEQPYNSFGDAISYVLSTTRPKSTGQELKIINARELSDRKIKKHIRSTLADETSSIKSVHSAYKVAIVLDGSKDSFTFRDGVLPFLEMTASIQSILIALMNGLECEDSIVSRVHVVVIVKFSDIYSSHTVWSGPLLLTTDISYVMSCLSVRIMKLEAELNKLKTEKNISSRSQLVSCIHVIDQNSRLFSEEMLTIGIIITTGNIEVDIITTVQEVSKNCIKLLIVCLQSDQSDRRGSGSQLVFRDYASLKLVTSWCGGSFVSFDSPSSLNLTNKVQLDQFYKVQALRLSDIYQLAICTLSKELIGTSLVRLQTYTLEAISLEYLIALKLRDGFIIKSIVTQTRANEPFISFVFNFEKVLSHMSSLVYEITFSKEAYGNSKVYDKSVYKWTRGTFSIEIRQLGQGTMRRLAKSEAEASRIRYLDFQCMDLFQQVIFRDVGSASSEDRVLLEESNYLSILEDVCCLDINLRFHRYLGTQTMLNFTINNRYFQEKFMKEISGSFPELHLVLSPSQNKHIFSSVAVSNQGKDDRVLRDEDNTLDSKTIVIVEVTQFHFRFVSLSLKIFRGCISAFPSNYLEFQSVFDRVLDSFDFKSIRLHRDLSSLISESRSVLSAKSKAFVRRISFHNEKFVDSMFSDFLHAKIQMGFHVLSGCEINANAVLNLSNREDIIVLCTVIRASNGVKESLLLCEISYAEVQFKIQYLWEPLGECRQFDTGVEILVSY